MGGKDRLMSKTLYREVWKAIRKDLKDKCEMDKEKCNELYNKFIDL